MRRLESVRARRMCRSLLLLLVSSACSQAAPAPSQTPTSGATNPQLIAPPTPVVADVRPSVRPILTVLNSTEADLLGAHFAEFQIARDPAFADKIADVSVPAASMQTSFTPAGDLPAPAVIYWRARVVRPDGSPASLFSTTVSFVTTTAFVAPTVAATLSLHVACTSGAFVSDFQFDGVLAATSTRAQFTLSASRLGGRNAGDLTLDAALSGGTLSGVLLGNAVDRNAHELSVFASRAANAAASVAGSAASDQFAGTAAGEFDGLNFFSDVWTCATADTSWTIESGGGFGFLKSAK